MEKLEDETSDSLQVFYYDAMVVHDDLVERCNNSENLEDLIRALMKLKPIQPLDNGTAESPELLEEYMFSNLEAILDQTSVYRDCLDNGELFVVTKSLMHDIVHALAISREQMNDKVEGLAHYMKQIEEILSSRNMPFINLDDIIDTGNGD